MAPSPIQQRRTHNTLLFQKLLNLRDGASPFTLVLDTLEQSGRPVVKEFARRAKISKSKIIFVSFSTLRKRMPLEVDVFISSRGKSLAVLRNEIISYFPSLPHGPQSLISNPSKYLLIIDTLNPLSNSYPSHLSTFLSSLLISPQVSLLATYHTDVPVTSSERVSYNPAPLTTLIFSATAILTISSLSHVIARKQARDKSLQEPVFGLQEGREGVLIGLGSMNNDTTGFVVNMELRRRSGRGILENFVLRSPSSSSSAKLQVGEFTLLDDHDLYASVPIAEHQESGGRGGEPETTFNLGLTEKQKKDREGVILPYFDAQKDGGAAGPGDGGRILYEMGAEDREDFDDEEDEI